MTPRPLGSLLISRVPPTKRQNTEQTNQESHKSFILFLGRDKALFALPFASRKTIDSNKPPAINQHFCFFFFLGMCSACHSLSLAWLAEQAQTCTNQLSFCKQHGISATISFHLSNILVVIMSHGKTEHGK